MMSNKVNTVLSGVGTFSDVVNTWVEQFDDGNLKYGVIAVGRMMRDMFDGDEQSERCALAICCAALNRQFKKSGQMLSIDDKGKLQTNYYSSGHERELVMPLVCE